MCHNWEEIQNAIVCLFEPEWTAVTFSTMLTLVSETLLSVTVFNLMKSFGRVGTVGGQCLGQPNTTTEKVTMAWLPSVLVPRCSTASHGWQRWRGHMVAARSHRTCFVLLMTSAWKQRRRSRERDGSCSSTIPGPLIQPSVDLRWTHPS